MDSVVYPLICSRLDVPVALANLDDFRDFPSVMSQCLSDIWYAREHEVGRRTLGSC